MSSLWRGDGVVALVASALARAYIRLVDATTRWRQVGRDHADPLIAGGPFIVAFWHQRLFMMPAIRREIPGRFVMLVSANRDGAMIARAVSRFGIEFVRGSTSRRKAGAVVDKGGAAALMALKTAIGQGAVVGVTPDGPRGPARVVQPGVLQLAAMTGAPILPVAYATSRARFMKSWDKFLLPLPFSRGAFVAGAPLRVGPDDDFADAAAELARRLDAVAAVADAAVRG